MEQKESVMREYHFCLSRVQQLEEGFLELRSGLGEEQQILLDEYIAACEALSEAEMLLNTKDNPSVTACALPL